MVVVIVFDLVNNFYDGMLLFFLENVEMYLIDMDFGEEMVVFIGFDVFWC